MLSRWSYLLLVSGVWAGLDCVANCPERVNDTEIEAKFAVVALDRTEHLTDALKAALGVSSIAEIRTLVLSQGVAYRQGYLDVAEGIRLFNLELTNASTGGASASLPFTPKEVRIRAEGEGKFVMTAKGKASGAARSEQEVHLDASKFDSLWPLTSNGRIAKRRLTVPYLGRFKLEVDVYEGAFEDGLISVEVEVPTVGDLQAVGILGLDVTTDPRYKNANLAAMGLSSETSRTPQ